MTSNPKNTIFPSKRLPYHMMQKPEDINPGYFIVRPNGGPLVPLIPIDELPEGLEFFGLKRSMEVEDTIGMANLGIRTNRVGFWKLVEKKIAELEHIVGKEAEGSSDGNVTMIAVSAHPTSTPTITPVASTIATSSVHATPIMVTNGPTGTSNQAVSPSNGVSAGQQAIKVSAPTTAMTTSPQATHTIQLPAAPAVPRRLPAQIKPTVSGLTGPSIIGPFEPQICKHWCAYGLCKWGENCRYLHIMPTSRAGLQEVGLADWPAWWRTVVGIPLGLANGSSDGIRLTERTKEKERERIGRLGVYPTGPRERFSRGLNIDYGRSAGDVELAREWEERLMRERARAKGKGNVAVNGKGKGKQRRGGVVRPPFLQTVVRDGKIVGVGIGDGSTLKTAKTDVNVQGKATTEKLAEKEQLLSDKLEQLNPVKKDSKGLAPKQEVVSVKGKKKESESEMTTKKKLDQHVVKATMAWEDDVEENKENVPPTMYLQREMESGKVVLQPAGVLVEI